MQKTSSFGLGEASFLFIQITIIPLGWLGYGYIA